MGEAAVDVAFPGDAFFVQGEAGRGGGGGLEGVPVSVWKTVVYVSK